MSLNLFLDTHSLILVSGLVNDASRGIWRGKYTMLTDDVAAAFEPVVNDVIGLVLAQIREVKGTVRRVLLVGGLGQSSYLRERIREVFPATEVLQPGNGLVLL